jgi:hypothetical protein
MEMLPHRAEHQAALECVRKRAVLETSEQALIGQFLSFPLPYRATTTLQTRKKVSIAQHCS